MGRGVAVAVAGVVVRAGADDDDGEVVALGGGEGLAVAGVADAGPRDATGLPEVDLAGVCEGRAEGDADGEISGDDDGETRGDADAELTAVADGPEDGVSTGRLVVPKGGADWDGVAVARATDEGFAAVVAHGLTNGGAARRCAGGTLATPPNPTTVAVATPATAAGPAQAPMLLTKRANTGICPSHAPKPMIRHNLPTDRFRKARTTSGSSCVPAEATRFCRAADTRIGRLYERGAVITS